MTMTESETKVAVDPRTGTHLVPSADQLLVELRRINAEALPMIGRLAELMIARDLAVASQEALRPYG